MLGSRTEVAEPAQRSIYTARTKRLPEFGRPYNSGGLVPGVLSNASASGGARLSGCPGTLLQTQMLLPFRAVPRKCGRAPATVSCSSPLISAEPDDEFRFRH